jgi:DUF2971 family protein
VSDIWYMLSDSEQYVYHYTSASTLADYILHTGTLRFSSFARLNDPREYKDFDLDGYALTDIGGDYPQIKASMELALKTRWHIACFVVDPPDAEMTAKRDALGAGLLDAMHERGHSRPRMWAQYAGGHSGACLVFRKALLDKAIRAHAGSAGLQVFCGPVVYRNAPVVGSLGPGRFSFSVDSVRSHGLSHTVERHIERYFDDLYLTKNRDWEAEREFRWLLRGSDESEVFVDFGSALVGIAMGELFPDPLKPAVGRYALRNDVSLTVMDWRRGVPQPKPITPRMLLPPDDPERPSSGW